MSVDTEYIAAVVNSMVGKFERLSNKKNDLTGDYAQDNSSYPTVNAVKTFVGSLFNGLHRVATTGEYSDLENVPVFDFVKQATAEQGYASSYYLTIDGSQVGAKINIEKDKMLRSISVETVGDTPTEEETAAGLTTGDRYILMIVNTVDNDGTSLLILPITDMFDLQTADGVTLELSASGVFSIKAGGVTSTELAANSVITAKIADNAVTTAKIADENVTTAKIADSNVTTAKINAKAVTLAKLADEVPAKWVDDADTEIEDAFSALATAINNL